MPVVPAEAVPLEQYVQKEEAAHKLKPDNEARILWANDSLKNKTEYSLVYLHGFTASQGEGDPVHRDMAKKFGCNLYLSRLAEHGVDVVTLSEVRQSLEAVYLQIVAEDEQAEVNKTDDNKNRR